MSSEGLLVIIGLVALIAIWVYATRRLAEYQRARHDMRQTWRNRRNYRKQIGVDRSGGSLGRRLAESQRARYEMQQIWRMRKSYRRK